MGFVLGVDAGGTFIDYFLMGPQGQISYKSPAQPRALDYGILQGLSGLAAGKGLTLERLLQEVELIVHGTTVTTNAVLTTTGAKTALLTTEGLIDLLEMRQGVREIYITITRMLRSLWLIAGYVFLFGNVWIFRGKS